MTPAPVLSKPVPVTFVDRPMLCVDELRKSFGGQVVFDHLSFEVAKGMIFSIIGPNGAGKTTLFNVLTGIYAADRGTLRLGDRDLGGLSQHDIANLGVARTFQNLQIFFNMGAVENVMVGANRFLKQGLLSAVFRSRASLQQDRECRDRACELMRAVGLERYIGSPTSSMPYGALKRLEIARALASRPSLLFLDEPAAGLTALERLQIMELIKQLSQDGPTIVLVEHDMKLVMEVSDRVLVLASGRKLAEGPPSSISSDPKVIEAYLGPDEAHDA